MADRGIEDFAADLRHEAAENFLDATKDTIDLATELSLAIASSEFETLQRVKEIEARLREEPLHKLG